MKLKNFFKKLANKKDIKRNANNDWAIKFNSKKLVLLKEDDGSLNIAIIACKQTKNMIKEFCNGEVNDSQFNKVACMLSGEVVRLEQRATTNFKGKNSYELYYKNREVAPLFDYSEQSARLFWTIDKYKALGEIKAEDRLTDVNLLLLQGKLNKEKQNLTKQAEQEIKRDVKDITSKSTKQQDAELEM